MSIATPTAKQQYTLSSGAQALPVPFYFLEDDHVKVIKAGTPDVTLVKGTDYTIAGAGDEDGGTVTTIAGTSADLQAGDQITIKREISITQTVNYVYNDRFPAETHERALDKLTMISQQQKEQLDRAVQFPETEVALAGNVMPGASERAGKILSFDAAGNITLSDPSTAVFTEGDGIQVSSIAGLKAVSVTGMTTGQHALVFGFAASGDGGGGIYKYESASAATEDYGIVVAPNAGTGRWIRSRQNNVISAKWFGAKGDGVTDDSAAIAAMLAFVRTGVANDPAGADRLSAFTAYIPAGTYVITTSETMLPSTYTTKARGYRILGDGLGQTQLWFKPTTGSRVMFSNANAFLCCDVRDILFRSDNVLNTFMLSVSNNPPGAVQRWSFVRCEWAGAWGKGFELQGNNNNSEWVWDDCGVSGEMTRFLYTAAVGASDQFLNFWFTHFKFWPTAPSPATNCMIELNAGGNVHVTDSDFSGLQSGVMFKLLGSTHSEGVCCFKAEGCRFELKSANVKVLESIWPQGIVAFKNCDFSSQAGLGYPSTAVAFDFNDLNFGGPMYHFENCSLIGLLRFSHSTDDFRHKKGMYFLNCDHRQFRDITDAFVFTSTTNDGGHRVPILEGCRGGGTGLNFYTAWAAATAYALGVQRRNGLSLYEVTVAGTSAGAGGPTGKGTAIADNTVTWKWIGNDTRDYASGDCALNYFGRNNPAGVKRRIVSFKGPTEGLPTAGGKLEIILPPHAMVVAARIYGAAGVSASGAAADYAISTAEAAPTVFATGAATPASAGWDYTWTGLFLCGTDIRKRTLILDADAVVDQINAGAVAFVEYIA